MIFKQLAVSVLNKVLGKYIKDLDINNFELAILSGQAVLKNLELKEDALKEFDLPVEVAQGYVGEISLTIPWTNLYSAPCYISVQNVYLIAGPVKDKLYDADKARTAEVNGKRKRLKQIEENEIKANSTEETVNDDSNNSFYEKLVAQVIKNLKVSVKNIHFRYEDKVTCLDHPFACGFTLQNLSAETTDDEWNTCVVDAAVTTVYKLASLDNLAVYWNTKLSDTQLYTGHWNWKRFMEDGISTKENIPRNFKFILHPLSAECHVILDQSSAVELDTPKLLVEVIQQDLALALSQKQFHNLMDLLDSFELMTVNQKYKKFQPTVMVHGSSKIWWKYAYTAICEEKIRMWSWTRIKEHRTRYKAYKELYKKKLIGFYEGEKERSLEHLQVLEDDLDIPSILIARQQAEMEVPPDKRQPKEASSTSPSKGWWSWMGMGAGDSIAPNVTHLEKEEDVLSKLTVAALPAEEKEKLYKAINYSEATAPMKYPVEYTKRRLTFNLDSCLVTLFDETQKKIAEISTAGFAAALEQRPGGDAFMFKFEVNGFQVHGTTGDSSSDERPCLVSTQNLSEYSGNPLLWFSAEMNPLDVKADYSVKLKIEPVQVNYDNITVDKVVDFFDVPNKSKLYELEAAAANKLQELQSWTRAGLEYAISQHKITYIAMDIRSPFIVIPEYGNLKSDGNLLILDLGHLTVISDIVNRINTMTGISDDELAKMFYDKFNVMVTDVQIILTNKASDWRGVQDLDAASSDHILPPTGLELQAFKSISAEYPELPQFKINAVIPKIWLKLSDTKYKEFIQFLDHFPFGKIQDLPKHPVGDTIDKEWARTTSTLSLEEASNIQAVVKGTIHSKNIKGNEDDDGDVWFDSVEYLPSNKAIEIADSPDLTQLVAEFVINQLLVTLDKAGSTVKKPYISLEIKDLKTKVFINTWNINVNTTLGFIELLDNHFHGADGLPLHVLSSTPKNEWISVTYIKANPKGPDFASKYNNTEQLLQVLFTSIDLTAKKEALASFQIFVFGLLESNKSHQSSLPIVFPKKAASLETIAEDEPLDVQPVLPVKQALTDLRIEAELQDVSVTLVAKEKNVGEIKIEGLNVKVSRNGSETKINTMLRNLSVLNATEGTLHHKILSLEDNTVFDCEVTLFDNLKKTDPLALDMTVDLKIGQFKFVYLSGFTAHIQNFVQALVSPETVAYAQNLTQQALKSQAQTIQASGTKMGLNVSIHAPWLIIPGHSFSKDMMVAELGRLQVTNAISKNKDGVLMDSMQVSLNSFEVHCLSDGQKMSTDYLVEPIKLDVAVKRILQDTHFNLPLIEVDAVLPLLQINLAVPDYKLLMTVLNKNLLEGKEELEAPPQPSESSSTIDTEAMEGIRQRLGSVFQEKSKDVSSYGPDKQVNIKCNINVNKVVVFSPDIVDNQTKPYLVLTVEKLWSTVILHAWTTNIDAELGTIELLDCINTAPEHDSQPVPILSSSKLEDLISINYKMVDPACPEFESTHCSVGQTAIVKFRKLNINLPHKTAVDLQEHVLALTASDETTLPQNIDDLEESASSSTEQSTQRTGSFKIGATLWEVDVVLSMNNKPLVNLNLRGLAADMLLWENGTVIKSTQRDLSITDLNPKTFYPKILSVENENVFDFEFKYFASEEVYPVDSESTVINPDGSLVLNIGRVNIVFIYRFLAELMAYIAPLSSPQSAKYVQETAQKTVQSQIENIKSQGSRILLDIAINAPLVIMPRHSSSIDMLIADLGHLELQNEFQVFELETREEKIVFDIMELTLQSVQLARGRMDLSNSSVVKRYLIEPIKMDTCIRRSLKSSCHEFPFIDAQSSLDYIKMNLGSKDYELLTTITQENLREAESGHVITVDATVVQSDVAPGDDKEADQPENPMSDDTTSVGTSSSQDAFDYFEFSFDIPGISLTLYNHEKDLDPFDSQSPIYDPRTALCLCDVDKTNLHIAVPSDNSVHVRGILHGFIVQDIRPDTSSAFPRLVDIKLQPYADILTSSSDEMCEFIYRQQTNGDIDILFQLQHATIFVNFPFIWPLLEFFTATAPTEPQNQVFVTPAASQTSLDAPPNTQQNVPPPRDQPIVPSGEVVLTDYKISVRGTIKDPDIVLLANPLCRNSEALLLQTELEFDYTMTRDHQNLHSNISGLQMVSCQYPDLQQTSFMVLDPCDLTFKYKTPVKDGRGQGISINLETMKLRFSPFLYKILNDVLLTLTGQEKVSEGIQTEGNEVVSPSHYMWEPKPITTECWEHTNETTVSPMVTRRSTGDKITLKAHEIQILVVNEVRGAQVPLIMVNTQVTAEAVDYTAQMKLEAEISVEMSYYNENLGAWEPLLEPLDEHDNPRWELQLKVFFADSYLSSFTPRDQETIDGPPQDFTDGPDAHRWFPWQSRSRSQTKKKIAAQRSRMEKKRRKSFKKSGRHRRREGISEGVEDEDLDYAGALQQFFVSATRLVSDTVEDQVDIDMTDTGFLLDEEKPQATYVVVNSHGCIQLTVTTAVLDVLTEVSAAFTDTSGTLVRSVPGEMFCIQNELGIHSTVTVRHDEKIVDKSDDLLTIKHRKRKIHRNISLTDAFANVAASLLAEQRKKKKSRLFSEPLLGRFRKKFLKSRQRAMSLPLGLEGKSTSTQKKDKFQIGKDCDPSRPKLHKSASCGVQPGTSSKHTASSLSVTKSLHETAGDDDQDDGKSSWRRRLRNRKNELIALISHEEEDETDGDQETVGQSCTLADLAGSNITNDKDNMEDISGRVAMAIGNVGSFVGGISSPTFSDTEVQQKEVTSTVEDSVDGSHVDEEESFISFEVDGYYVVDYVPINRSGRYLYKLKPVVGNESNLNIHVVVQIDTKNGQKTVTLRSPLQVHNHLAMAMDLLVYDDMKIGSKDPYKFLQTLDPGTISNVPMMIAHDKDLYLRPHHPRCGVCPDCLSWRSFSKKDIILKFPQVPLVRSLESLESLESLDSERPLQVKIHFQVDLLNKTPSNDVPHHVIHLHPPITLHNLLPVELARIKDEDNVEEIILPGEKVTVMTESVEHSCQLTLKVNNYKDQDWIGVLDIDDNTQKAKKSTLTVTSTIDLTSQLILGVLIMHSGTTDITIYCPYWLINKASLPMEYRVSKTHEMYYQTCVGDEPLLFSFPLKSNRKVRLRISDAEWSDHISLDAVGDSGLVSCRDAKKKRKFKLVLQIVMSQTGLTKIVTLTPKYVVINKTDFSISFCEEGTSIPMWSVIEPDEVKPFWPISSIKRIYLKPTLSSFVSKAVPYNYSHTSVLRMLDPRAIGVEVHGEVEDSVTTILFTPYSPGVGTIRIENLSNDITLRFMQGTTGHVTLVQPKFSMLYTWDDPAKERHLLWKPFHGTDDALEALVNKDGFGKLQFEMKENGPDMKEERKLMEDSSTHCECTATCFSSPMLSSDSEETGSDEVDGLSRPFSRRTKRTIYWVSLLDGLQRVLLFTEDVQLALKARKSSECEPVAFEVFVSLDGVGLSLMNNKPEEVANITLSSSTSVWQVEKSPGHWKTLSIELSTWLEDAWKNGEQQLNMDDTATVDFSRMEMVAPYEGSIRRSFEPALWFHYCSSKHYQSVHAKMHRIQIDNQLHGTVFPVALYPAPLPPGVALRHGPKPFIEMSVIYHEVPGKGVHHFKYAKVLVQEMNVKLDKSFILALASLLSKPPESYDEEVVFNLDTNSYQVPLKETMAVKAALQTQRVFLEYFHLSPLKVNLSFSLGSDVDEDPDQELASDIMDFFIDSIGATLTDMNDAQLKLAFFERVGVFITQENLQTQITTHYTMQGVRQIYALVLGLDVLGNPYALLTGIGEGVKDLFYEPYQGIIYGPQEFAEGLARGVKSLLGHVVGGTAGAFSRITGSIGQAVATLSFDTDYRLQRRQRMHVEPSGFGQGLVMGGKSLVMGLVFGIGGIVIKPVEGARSEGVEGFFKGIGKGLLGLLTRPTGGVIDMVSFTLDGIRRSAEQGGEDIAHRMRLPRFAAPNEPLKPYSIQEATGFGILRSLPRRLELTRDIYASHFTLNEENRVVLLTNRRVIMAFQNRFWHEWKVAWMCSYEEVTSPPFIAGHVLIIKYQKTSDDDITTNVHEIQCDNPEHLKDMKIKMNNLIRRYK